MTAEQQMPLPGAPVVSSVHPGQMLLSLLGLGAALVLWKLAVAEIDVRQLDDFGLVALLPWQLWLALAILSTGFVMSLHMDMGRTPLPLAHLFVLVVILHLTPALVYDNVRYPWVWKHIGMVDFIQRHGTVDRDARFLKAYQNWPGLFYATAWISNLFGWGVTDLARLSRYAPPVFEAGFVVALTQVYQRLTVDLRIVWVAVWVFLCGNWIGQDYYSPQAVALLLYLLIIGLCLGPLRSRQWWTANVRGTVGLLAAKYVTLLQSEQGRGPDGFRQSPGSLNQLAALLVFAVAVLGLVTTHQLTPIALILALSALFAVGQINLSYLLFVLTAELLWLFYFASPYVAQNLAGEFRDFGSGIHAASGRMVDVSLASAGKWWVVAGGRACALGISIMAIAGGILRLRAGYRDVAAAVLVLAPLPMVATSYGGEILFRVYMFALPFLAFFAAAAVFTRPFKNSALWFRPVLAAVLVMLCVGFYFGDNGKDLEYTYSTKEIAASTWVLENAPAGTLLVEGCREYPSQFMNYENFTYLPIDQESQQERARIVARPASILADWMSGSRWTAGYVIITRSQKLSTEYNGALPHGALDRMEQALLQSPDFNVVYANEDARVFAYKLKSLEQNLAAQGEPAVLRKGESEGDDQPAIQLDTGGALLGNTASDGAARVGETVTAYAMLALLAYLFSLAINRTVRMRGPLLIAALLLFSAAIGFAVVRGLAFLATS